MACDSTSSLTMEKDMARATAATAPTAAASASAGNHRQDQLVVGRRKARKLAQFYAGKNIFITGATGFIGKVFLLKLMASLGECGKVYVMLRGKKGMTPQQRFNQMLQEIPFNTQQMDFKHFPNCDEMKAEFGKFLEKAAAADWSRVIPIEGDMSRENLGLSQENCKLLESEVNVIFNIAASVQFDAPLKQNLRDNYLGANNLLRLATKFGQLVSLVHVSTFYSNSHLSHVEEKVLPMNCDHEKMAELISWVPDSVLDQMGPQIMESRPNTYIFTKAMSENLVQKYQGQLPVAIVRPSIVVPSMREPEPGWVDNVNGPMGLGVLAALGILRNIDWNYWGVCDFVPVDSVVNSMLAVGERTPRLYPNEIKVYNCSTSSLNPVTWGRCFETMRQESFNAPPYKMLRIPIDVPKHKRANKLAFGLTKLSEILFAYFIDFILVLCGQKRLLSRLTAKLHHGYEILRYFTTNEYTCSNNNLIEAFEELEEDDKEEFDFDLKKIDWDKGFALGFYGARKRLLKEDLSNVPAALFKMRVLTIVEFVFKVLFVSLIAWAAYRMYQTLFVLDELTSSTLSTSPSIITTASASSLPQAVTMQ